MEDNAKIDSMFVVDLSIGMRLLDSFRYRDLIVILFLLQDSLKKKS